MDSATINAIATLLNALGAIITALTGLLWTSWRVRQSRFPHGATPFYEAKPRCKLGPKRKKRKSVNGNEETPQSQELH